jgi:two-component system heavy metal sensor histidine kinase CusS
MKRPISLTARMSLLFALSAVSVLMITGAVFERALNERLLKRDKEELAGKMELVKDIVMSSRKLEDASELPVRLNDVVFGHPGMVVSVRTETGAVLFSAGSELVVKQLQDEASPVAAQPVTKKIGGQFYRLVSSRVMRAARDGGPIRMMIALDITEDQDFVTELQRYIWFGMAQVALVLGAVGWFVVRHGLAPLRKV